MANHWIMLISQFLQSKTNCPVRVDGNIISSMFQIEFYAKCLNLLHPEVEIMIASEIVEL